MLSEDKFFQTLTEAELWQRYCGFLDLSIDQFMEIQNTLLMDQIGRIANSTLGQKIMGNQKPKSQEEFRRIVPLTAYKDYDPYLSERDVKALAIEPAEWCHSAGRGGNFKWIPLSAEFLDKVVKNALATFILATAQEKGRVNCSPGARLLFMLAPPPYASGVLMQAVSQHFSFQSLTGPDKSGDLPFADRIKKGFNLALKDGVDIVGSLPSVLVRMGDEFGKSESGRRFSLSMLHPRVLFVLLAALWRSKREKRGILPKDLWPTKSVMVGGMDAHIYRDDILRYWGGEPYEFYIASETFYISVNSWNKKWLTFVPDMVFLEFIPYQEVLKLNEDEHYQPATVLLNEVKEGELYEVAITQLYGMPLLRYRMRDIIKIIALKDDETGINLPQMVFQRRVDEAINIGGLAQLDEKTIWQAMDEIGISYIEWTAGKEFDGDKAFLWLYIELREPGEASELETALDKCLGRIDTDYKDVHYYLDYQPVRVKILNPGTFQRYTEERVREGTNPAHLKPVHINPSEAVISRLLQLSEECVANDATVS